MAGDSSRTRPWWRCAKDSASTAISVYPKPFQLCCRLSRAVSWVSGSGYSFCDMESVGGWSCRSESSWFWTWVAWLLLAISLGRPPCRQGWNGLLWSSARGSEAGVRCQWWLSAKWRRLGRVRRRLLRCHLGHPWSRRRDVFRFELPHLAQRGRWKAEIQVIGRAWHSEQCCVWWGTQIHCRC